MCISQSPFRKDILNWFLQLKGLQFLGMIHSMWKLDTTWFENSFFFHVYSCLTYIKQGFYLILKKKSNIFVWFLQAEVSTLALKGHIFLYRGDTLDYSRNGTVLKVDIINVCGQFYQFRTLNLNIPFQHHVKQNTIVSSLVCMLYFGFYVLEFIWFQRKLLCLSCLVGSFSVFCFVCLGCVSC